MKRFVLDASALIRLPTLAGLGKAFTVPSVVQEVRDRASRMRLEAMELSIVEPRQEFRELVESKARETGDLSRLSKPDLELLALAKQIDGTLLTDDRGVQNMALKLGLRFLPVQRVPVRKPAKLGMFCPACKRFFEAKVCPVCGHELKPRILKLFK